MANFKERLINTARLGMVASVVGVAACAPATTTPDSEMDYIDCTVASGSVPTDEETSIRLYQDGPLGDGGVLLNGENTEKQLGRQVYRVGITSYVKDRRPHKIYAYYGDKDGHAHLLPGYPRVILCPPDNEL